VKNVLAAGPRHLLGISALNADHPGEPNNQSSVELSMKLSKAWIKCSAGPLKRKTMLQKLRRRMIYHGKEKI